VDRPGDRHRDDDPLRRCHAIHHATSGNLERRGIGDIKTLTVCEYFARNRRGRIGYRLYRHPLVMFGIGPAYLFLIENRLPFGFMRKGAMPWVSTMTTNAGILLAAGLLLAAAERVFGRNADRQNVSSLAVAWLPAATSPANTVDVPATSRL
jgi:fatty acid desaturase